MPDDAVRFRPLAEILRDVSVGSVEDDLGQDLAIVEGITRMSFDLAMERVRKGKATQYDVFALWSLWVLAYLMDNEHEVFKRVAQRVREEAAGVGLGLRVT